MYSLNAATEKKTQNMKILSCDLKKELSVPFSTLTASVMSEFDSLRYFQVQTQRRGREDV